jgi:hypothetical protein
MKVDKKAILIIILIFIIGFITFNFTKSLYQKKVQKAQRELINYKIKADTLARINENQYRKLLADTLTKRELLKKIDSLKIKADNPIVVTEVLYEFDKKETEGEIKTTDSTMTFTDYYPDKENPFIKYSAEINKIKNTYKGSFDVKPLSLNLVFSQNKEGVYQLDSKVPDYISISKIDIQSTPLNSVPESKKAITTFAGLKYNNSFLSEDPFIETIVGLRYRRINLIGSLSTNSYLGLGILIDF